MQPEHESAVQSAFNKAATTIMYFIGYQWAQANPTLKYWFEAHRASLKSFDDFCTRLAGQIDPKQVDNYSARYAAFIEIAKHYGVEVCGFENRSGALEAFCEGASEGFANTVELADEDVWNSLKHLAGTLGAYSGLCFAIDDCDATSPSQEQKSKISSFKKHGDLLFGDFCCLVDHPDNEGKTRAGFFEVYAKRFPHLEAWKGELPLEYWNSFRLSAGTAISANVQ